MAICDLHVRACGLLAFPFQHAHAVDVRQRYRRHDGLQTLYGNVFLLRDFCCGVQPRDVLARHDECPDYRRLGRVDGHIRRLLQVLPGPYAFDVLLFPHSSDGVAHFAHLGGVVGGFLYMYLYEHGFGNTLAGARRSMEEKIRSRRFKAHEGGRNDGEGTVYRNGPARSDEPIEGEVFYVDEQKRMDEILKKVNSEGINSLTESERQFLLRAGEKLRRRRGGF